MKDGRTLAIALIAVATLPCGGCGLAPHAFRKMQPTAPVVRAHAVGQGRRQPDSQVVPALIARLDDEDPVVRLTAGEELRKRTGHDFGFVPWASQEERSAAVARWRTWLTGPPVPAESLETSQAPGSPAAAVVAAQPARAPSRRRRRRARVSAHGRPPVAAPRPTPPITETTPS